MTKKKRAKQREARFLLFVFLIILVVGLFFLSPNITGNAIGGLDKGKSNIFGLVLVVFGIAGYYFFYKFLGSYL
jgi:membrane associated rhomboid family serine protease